MYWIAAIVTLLALAVAIVVKLVHWLAVWFGGVIQTEASSHHATPNARSTTTMMNCDPSGDRTR